MNKLNVLYFLFIYLFIYFFTNNRIKKIVSGQRYDSVVKVNPPGLYGLCAVYYKTYCNFTLWSLCCSAEALNISILRLYVCLWCPVHLGPENAQCECLKACINAGSVYLCRVLVAPTFGEDCSHLEVAAGQSDDGGLVQLGCDGRRQRQQLGQLIKLSVLFLSPRLRCVLASFLHFWKFQLNDSCRKVARVCALEPSPRDACNKCTQYMSCRDEKSAPSIPNVRITLKPSNE